MPYFGKGGGSRNSHEMRLSDMPGMGILISLSLQTYTANIGIWRGSIPINASMFWVTLSGDSASFCFGRDTFLMMLTLSMSFKVKVPIELMRPTSSDGHNKMNDTKSVMIG